MMVIFSNSISNPFALGDEPVHQADPRLCVHTILDHYNDFITDEELVALGDELSIANRPWQAETSDNLENYLSSVPAQITEDTQSTKKLWPKDEWKKRPELLDSCPPQAS